MPDISCYVRGNALISNITKPTRVTSNFSTIMDHILTNYTSCSIFPAIIESMLTDHYPIFCTLQITLIHRKKSSSITNNQVLLSTNEKILI